MGSLYNNIGWGYFESQDYAAALDMFDKALAFRQAQKKPVEIRIARWCVAKAYRYLDRTDEALAIQQDLLAELNAAEAKPDGYVFEELAECLFKLGRLDEARPHFRSAYQLLSQDPWLAEKEPERIARLKKLAGAP